MVVEPIVGGLLDFRVRVVSGGCEDGFGWQIVKFFFLGGGLPSVSNHFRHVILFLIENRFNFFWD